MQYGWARGPGVGVGIGIGIGQLVAYEPPGELERAMRLALRLASHH
jgi:hypothetical protein